jgi:S1-C subfamily serine protease
MAATTTVASAAFAGPRLLGTAPSFLTSVSPVLATNVQGQGPQATQKGRQPSRTAVSRSSVPPPEGAVFLVSGIRLSPINAQLASYLGAGSELGLLVLEISDDWAGLLAGDVILSIDGRPVRRNGMSYISLDESKDQCIKLLRGGETMKVTLRRR